MEGYEGHPQDRETDALDRLRDQEQRIRRDRLARDTTASREAEAAKLRKKLRDEGHEPCA